MHARISLWTCCRKYTVVGYGMAVQSSSHAHNHAWYGGRRQHLCAFLRSCYEWHIHAHAHCRLHLYLKHKSSFGDPGHRSKTAFLGLQEDSSHNFTRRQSLRSHLAQVLLLSSTCTCGIPIQPPLDCAATARCGYVGTHVHVGTQKG